MMIRKALLPLLLCLSAPLFAATADRPLKSFPEAALKDKDPKADVIFVVAGDNRPAAKGAPMPRVLDTIFSEIALIRPDFVLWTGDTVYGYCDTEPELEAEYQAFRDKARSIAGVVPLFNAPGNHEIHSDQSDCKTGGTLCWADPQTPAPRCSERSFRNHFGELYGSFNYAGAHFIALDTAVPGDEDAISGDQLQWLKDDLKSARDARAIFLFTHTEFFSSPLIDPPAGRSHPAVARRWELMDLFERSPVAAVFSGHEHLFWHEPPEKHNFIDYFVAGGAGAPLYAPPDRGGFSHYLVVKISGGKVSYELIEPGRLYVESAAGTLCPGAACFWFVDSNDVQQPLLLRGLDVEVPASLGDCAGLTATAQARRRDGWVPVPNVAIDCAASTGGKLHVNAPALAQGSVLLTVSRKSNP
ncbi:MAG: metallophosphoesterase [Acidobacteria bacterium]|nr:metallophosphoesterase [Acidobacteriota bacterium]